MYCSKCGNEIKDGARFCKVCGQEVSDMGTVLPSGFSGKPDGRTVPMSETKSHRRALIWLAVIAVIMVFAAVIALVLVKPWESDEEPVKAVKEVENKVDKPSKKEDKADDSAIKDIVEEVKGDSAYDAFIDRAKGFKYINGLGGYFDVTSEPFSNDSTEDISDIPLGMIDCFIEDFDRDGADELLMAEMIRDEHILFTMYEYYGKVVPSGEYEFEYPVITCGDNSTHVFSYDHDGKECIGIFNDVGYGMGVEYYGTLQFTCLKYDGSRFSEKHYYGYVGSDGEVDTEYFNTIKGCGINLDWEQIEGQGAIGNIISVTGGKRMFDIDLHVNNKFGEGYCTVWYGGSAEFFGYSGYDFAMADKKDIEEWESRKKQHEASYYVIPDSSLRLLTEEDLAGLSKDDLRIARNEIVARHERKFKDKDLQAYFDSKPWYNGMTDPEYFDESCLSDIERKNMDFIKKHE